MECKTNFILINEPVKIKFSLASLFEFLIYLKMQEIFLGSLFNKQSICGGLRELSKLAAKFSCSDQSTDHVSSATDWDIKNQ